MEYRRLPHGSEEISVLGFGTSSIGMAGEKEAEAAMTLALENGVNYFDMASADAVPFAAFGRAMAGGRDKVYFQIHFGADYADGKYGWTTDLDTIKRSVDWQLRALKTDYIDFGFLHCLDEEEDLRKALTGGTLDYILELKKQGVVRHIGMSSHTPQVVWKALDAGILDMLMFSINPAYDYRNEDEYAIGSLDERQKLYRRCEAEGVGGLLELELDRTDRLRAEVVDLGGVHVQSRLSVLIEVEGESEHGADPLPHGRGLIVGPAVVRAEVAGADHRVLADRPHARAVGEGVLQLVERVRLRPRGDGGGGLAVPQQRDRAPPGGAAPGELAGQQLGELPQELGDVLALHDQRLHRAQLLIAEGSQLVQHPRPPVAVRGTGQR